MCLIISIGFLKHIHILSHQSWHLYAYYSYWHLYAYYSYFLTERSGSMFFFKFIATLVMWSPNKPNATSFPIINQTKTCCIILLLELYRPNMKLKTPFKDGLRTNVAARHILHHQSPFPSQFPTVLTSEVHHRCTNFHKLPSGKHTKSYWKWPSRNSGLTH